MRMYQCFHMSAEQQGRAESTSEGPSHPANIEEFPKETEVFCTILPAQSFCSKGVTMHGRHTWLRMCVEMRSVN